MIIAYLNYLGVAHVLLDQYPHLEKDKVDTQVTDSYTLLPAEPLLTSGAITKQIYGKTLEPMQQGTAR